MSSTNFRKYLLTEDPLEIWVFFLAFFQNNIIFGCHLICMWRLYFKIAIILQWSRSSWLLLQWGIS